MLTCAKVLIFLRLEHFWGGPGSTWSCNFSHGALRIFGFYNSGEELISRATVSDTVTQIFALTQNERVQIQICNEGILGLWRKVKIEKLRQKTKQFIDEFAFFDRLFQTLTHVEKLEEG